MRRSSCLPVVLTAALLSGGCGDDGREVFSDTGTSADGGGDADAGPVLDPPALPSLTPCPPGWREVGDPARCDPWPESGRADCPLGEAHFVGTEGCERLSSPCGDDGWPVDAPTASGTLFVRAGATGFGSRSNPLGLLVDAVAMARLDAVIVLSDGVHEGIPSPRSTSLELGDVTIMGCGGDTIVEAAATSESVFSVVRGEVTIRDLTIRSAVGGAIDATTADTSLILENVEIDGAVARGIELGNRASLTARRTTIHGVRGAASIAISGTGAPTLSIDQAVIDDVEGTGIAISGASGSAEIRDTAVFDLTLAGSTRAARAMQVWQSAQMTVERVYTEVSRDFSLFAFEGGTMTARDVVIRDMAAPDESWGKGLMASRDATLDAERVWVQESKLGAVRAEIGSEVSLRDIVVEGSIGAAPAALIVTDAGGSAERVFVTGASGGIVVAGEGVVVDLSDFTAVGLRSNEFQVGGHGLWAAIGGLIRGSRWSVVDGRNAGILATGTSSRVEGVDVSIVGVGAPECDEPCAISPVGIGAGALSDGVVQLAELEIAECTDAAVQIFDLGSVSLQTGVIRDNPIGANIQVEGYDRSTLTDDVEFSGNGVDFDESELELPQLPRGI